MPSALQISSYHAAAPMIPPPLVAPASVQTAHYENGCASHAAAARIAPNQITIAAMATAFSGLPASLVTVTVAAAAALVSLNALEAVTNVVLIYGSVSVAAAHVVVIPVACVTNLMLVRILKFRSHSIIGFGLLNFMDLQWRQSSRGHRDDFNTIKDVGAKTPRARQQTQ
ncbi:hypothetical protein MLD38_006953 [Melastoma candidum]|uniref:Uncharacterized protein n=1 Tax=Melastoma candidum TaxID=119954 RepID=A0ACB9RP31_9MYRT|nr:hypothetical protein MLD38_006953 [Melastoma candidum]